MPRMVIYPQPNPNDPVARWRTIRHRGILRYIVNTSLFPGYPIVAIVWAISYGLCRIFGSSRIDRLTDSGAIVTFVMVVPATICWNTFGVWRAARKAQQTATQCATS